MASQMQSLFSGKLSSFCDKLTRLAGEGKVLGVALMDLSKALDTVPHSILLDKLSSCEVNRCTLRCVKNGPFNMRKHLFTETVVKRWSRPLREVINKYRIS